MSDDPIRVRWAGRTDFAEIAEALGVPTDQIMAASVRQGVLFVIYNPEPYDEDNPRAQEVWTAILARDSASDVPIVAARKKSDLTWADIEAQIEERMRERFGPPDSQDSSREQ